MASPPILLKSTTSVRVWNRKERISQHSFLMNEKVLEKENKAMIKEIDQMKAMLVKKSLSRQSLSRQSNNRPRISPGGSDSDETSQDNVGTNATLQKSFESPKKTMALRRKATFGKSLNKVCNADEYEKTKWEQQVLRRISSDNDVENSLRAAPKLGKLQRSTAASSTSVSTFNSRLSANKRTVRRCQSVIPQTFIPSKMEALPRGASFDSELEPYYIRRRFSEQIEISDLQKLTARIKVDKTAKETENNNIHTLVQQNAKFVDDYDEAQDEEMLRKWRQVSRFRSHSCCNSSTRLSDIESITEDTHRNASLEQQQKVELKRPKINGPALAINQKHPYRPSEIFEKPNRLLDTEFPTIRQC